MSGMPLPYPPPPFPSGPAARRVGSPVMATLSTHVLDTARGVPAAGLAIRLEGEDHIDATGWRELAAATTDDDGRAKLLDDGAALDPGDYRLEFATGDWH